MTPSEPPHRDTRPGESDRLDDFPHGGPDPSGNGQDWPTDDWPPVWTVTWVDDTGSTNADLAAAAKSGAPAGTVLVADFQTAGRGRLDRTWTAPPGSSLLCSLLLRPDLRLNQLHRCTQAVALAAADACGQIAGVTVDLKWPNDLLVDGKKLAGVLAESVLSADRVDAVIVGIGINVNWPHELPLELAHATSLSHHRPIDADPIDRAVLLDALLATMINPAADVLGERFRARLATLGQRVTVETAQGAIEGVAIDVKSTGELVVDTETGTRVFAVGDVVHLRPA
jgi:BirA family transcriptional regulator, biotin operon repressor / biotin---[acetyl-CoA-carboxylase] ligase